MATYALMAEISANFTSTQTLYIGAQHEGANAVNDMAGVMGDNLIYERAVTAVEIMNNYLATKWKYGF